MALSAFAEKTREPDPAALDEVLGPAAALWHRLVADVTRRHAPIAGQWTFSGAQYGWSLRLKRPDRVVLYLTPQGGRFLAGVVLGEKAARAARDGGASQAVLALIEGAPRYAEGRGIRMPVARPGDLQTVRRLLALKMGS